MWFERMYSVTLFFQSLGMLFHYIVSGGGHPFGNPDSLPGECVKNINRGA